MKNFTLFIISFFTIQVTNGQTINGNYLDINNIKARINADGSLFNDYGSSLAQRFEVPKGSGRHTIYASGLWIGGIDAGAVLKIAGQTYRQTGNDFWPGPLTNAGTTTPATITAFDRVWKISKCDINAYTNWVLAGKIGTNPVDSTAMEAINTWPASSPFGGILAPFIDLNSNGIYEPASGETPNIKGDQAIFFVCNDKGGAHTETGGTPIGVEVQGMAYAYSCPDDSALYNTIFTSYKIINKSPMPIDSVFIENWTDLDIGFSADDYVACDVTRGAYYGYNADPDDTPPPTSSQLGYGINPPAQAVVFLRGPLAYLNGIDDPASATPNGTNYGDGIIDNERLGMSKFIYYNNDFSVRGNPSASHDFYNYMAGAWKDSTSLTYGGTGYATGVDCDYMFPGNSDPLGYGTNMVPQPIWDEITSANPPGDRRGMGAYGPFIFQPGETRDFDFAYVFGRATSGGNLASVTVMKERIDSVRHKFMSPIAGCGCSVSTGINELKDEDSFSVYPNPASDNITIHLKTTSRNYSLKMYDATGRLVKNIEHVNSITNTIDITDLKKGMYLVNLQDGNNSLTKRFIKD